MIPTNEPPKWPWYYIVLFVVIAIIMMPVLIVGDVVREG